MSKYVLVLNKKQLFDNKEFNTVREAYDYAEQYLNDEDYSNVETYTKKEFQEELEQEKFIIVDWAYNRMFKDISFDDEEDAMDYVCTKFSDDEMEDIFVIQTKEYEAKTSPKIRPIGYF